MTYFQFHLLFNLPLLACLILLGASSWVVPEITGTALLVLVPVIVFTTPWDNYAARWGIWGFSKGQYWKKVGYLPVEEYLFFIIQSLQAMALTVLVVPWLGGSGMGTAIGDRDLRLISGGAVWLMLVAAGWKLGPWFRQLTGGKWHYTGHLLYWFLPVIALQWWIAPDILLPQAEVLVVVTLLLGTYLSWADWMAIERNIWFFDHAQTTGVRLGEKMPWEEAAFFYLTSLLVSQSFLLLLPEFWRTG